MTVKELRNFLEKLPDEMEIWIHYNDRYDDGASLIELFENDLSIPDGEYLIIDGRG